MKTIIYIFLFVILSQICLAQGGVGIDNNTNQLFEIIKRTSGLNVQSQSSAVILKKPKKIVGKWHLFKGWDNDGIIYVDGGKRYKINNINLNVKDNRFESEVGKDSIFSFDLNNIDYVIINSKKFRNIYFHKTSSNKIFEIIIDSDNFSLLKEYSSDIKRNEVDPLMLKPNVDEYIINSSYYILKNNSIEKFKLNRKSILSILNVKDNTLVEYAKTNKLSFKKDDDLKNIFLYWKNHLQ